jgi:hypothetical protein
MAFRYLKAIVVHFLIHFSFHNNFFKMYFLQIKNVNLYICIFVKTFIFSKNQEPLTMLSNLGYNLCVDFFKLCKIMIWRTLSFPLIVGVIKSS